MKKGGRMQYTKAENMMKIDITSKVQKQNINQKSAKIQIFSFITQILQINKRTNTRWKRDFTSKKENLVISKCDWVQVWANNMNVFTSNDYIWEVKFQ